MTLLRRRSLALMTTFVMSSSVAIASPCSSPANGAAMLIDATCVDPEFAKPIIDAKENISTPIKGLRVSGHFEGSNARFQFVFPEKEQWDGRFYQQVYPNTPTVADEVVKFGANDGAYTVHTASSGGYRLDAAAAKFAKTIAADYYGTSGRIFGYVYGGSGGSYQVIGAVENTVGVWDGGVPYVMGTQTSIPNNFFIRAFARLVLSRHASRISDAVAPGGSGDVYSGLSTTEQGVLSEVSELGVPLRGWEDATYLLGLEEGGGLLGFLGSVQAADPTYVEDFWSKSGYLGAEASELGNLVRASRVRYDSVLKSVQPGNGDGVFEVQVEQAPPESAFFPVELTVLKKDGTQAGRILTMYDRVNRSFRIETAGHPSLAEALLVGARVRLDNSWPLAATTYHRHQVPESSDFTAWNILRDSRGQPRYPQRTPVLASGIAQSVTGGSTYSGDLRFKAIIVSNLLDVDAFPWHGAWYHDRVKSTLGARADQMSRLWLNDNADHLDGQVIASGSADAQRLRLINYTGIVQQAVRDVSAWAEKGTPPAKSTAYRFSKGQMSVPANASAKGGIQPVVTLSLRGARQARVRTGTPVELRVQARVPAGAGNVIAVEWSDTGDHQLVSDRVAPAQKRITAVRTVTFDKPGTYYPAVMVTSTRLGNDSRFGRVSNLARVRVVVE
ncbi:hypothetical protein ABB28_02995 [Stenotrophomonas chelatiphaga]|uniref:Tat pathway signal sequence domain protein n=2 Tax=Stenotrophomonas chelatiphaga TaxID=517011 RepID=A0A0R0D2U2_9GAMM|nr:hypothetical protein ABB28_02995 [Stenotrophomonas chelatiphaga]